MADISMCFESDCTKKETCYRYKATRSVRQSMAAFYKEGEECKYYWKTEEKKDD